MNNNRCICCDEIIPEGRQICPICEKTKYLHRQLIFICSPFHSKDLMQQAVNIENAKSYCRLAYQKGYLPIAPHLFFPQFLNDNYPTERQSGIWMGEQLMLNCSKMWVCGDKITDGMKKEISFAIQHGIPYEHITYKGAYSLLKGTAFCDCGGI